jgi:hypothetical protein
MEDRSSRRLLTLVTLMAIRGLSANEKTGALISIMARSTKRSNQRPDTLMQDPNRQIDENLLRRTAGPYIGVNSIGSSEWRTRPQDPRSRQSDGRLSTQLGFFFSA